jgi:pilus assembly protein TadC
MYRLLSTLAIVLLLVSIGTGAAPGSPSQAKHVSVDYGALVIAPTFPLPNATIHTQLPNITATFSDTVSPVLLSSVVVKVDGVDVTNVEGTWITEQGVRYNVSSLLKLKYGNASVDITASDMAHNAANYSWNFTVAPPVSGGGPGLGINPLKLLFYVGIGTLIFGIAFGGAYLYARQARRFAFRKYFAIHPVEREYLVLYIPVAVTFVVTLVALIYVVRTPGLPWWAVDAVFVVALWMALTAYALDARRQKARIRAFERAFAQFLFEMADAMRGGLDPAKALIELSTTYTNIMAKPMRVAADGIRMGRSFDVVLKNMVASMHSPLISRYAGLVADASTAGGETALVVHRAAKDMDDFIKIEQERANQLALPIAVLFISYAILMAVLFSLLYIAPSLGSFNLGVFGGSPLSGGGSAGATVPKLPVTQLRDDFLYLGLIVSIGTGCIVGVFTEGRVKYGLIHSLGLAAATLVAFIIFFPH